MTLVSPSLALAPCLVFAAVPVTEAGAMNEVHDDLNRERSSQVTRPHEEGDGSSNRSHGSAGKIPPLAVARCPYALPQLPAQSEVALDATLLVRVGDGIGSAFAISSDGFALTAAHVVQGRTEVEVVAHGGAELQASVVRVHSAQDVALLKVDVPGSMSCLRPREGAAPLGTDVYILGSPAGEELSFSLSKGIVSGYRNLSQARFVQLDASLNPGNSGGPAVDGEGHVVGIASWKVSHVSMEGLAFAVPADLALEVLGVDYGEHSDPAWADKRGRVSDTGLAPLSVVSSPVAARPSSVPSNGLDTAALRRKNIRSGFIWSGVTGLAVGTVVVSMTFLADRIQRSDSIIDDSPTETQWRLTRGFNTAGWALGIAGGVALITGLAIPKRTKGRRGQGAAVSVTPQGVVFASQF